MDKAQAHNIQSINPAKPYEPVPCPEPEYEPDPSVNKEPAAAMWPLQLSIAFIHGAAAGEDYVISGNQADKLY